MKNIINQKSLKECYVLLEKLDLQTISAYTAKETNQEKSRTKFRPIRFKAKKLDPEYVTIQDEYWTENELSVDNSLKYEEDGDSQDDSTYGINGPMYSLSSEYYDGDQIDYDNLDQNVPSAQPLICVGCSAIFDSKRQLAEHVLAQNGACNYESYVTKPNSNSEIHNHHQQVSLIADNAHICPFCNVNHQNLETIAETLSHDLVYFSDKDSLACHIWTVHKNEIKVQQLSNTANSTLNTSAVTADDPNYSSSAAFANTNQGTHYVTLSDGQSFYLPDTTIQPWTNIGTEYVSSAVTGGNAASNNISLVFKCPATGCENLFTSAQTAKNHALSVHSPAEFTQLSAKIDLAEQTIKANSTALMHLQTSSNHNIMSDVGPAPGNEEIVLSASSASAAAHGGGHFVRRTSPKKDHHHMTSSFLAEGGEQPPHLTCSHCDATFLSRGSLRAHVTNAHDHQLGGMSQSECSSSWVWSCDICSRTFHKRSHLNRHLASAVHADVLTYRCDLCGMRFDTPTSLEDHLVDFFYHKDPDISRLPKYVCYICTFPHILNPWEKGLDFIHHHYDEQKQNSAAVAADKNSADRDATIHEESGGGNKITVLSTTNGVYLTGIAEVEATPLLGAGTETADGSENVISLGELNSENALNTTNSALYSHDEAIAQMELGTTKETSTKILLSSQSGDQHLKPSVDEQPENIFIPEKDIMWQLIEFLYAARMEKMNHQNILAGDDCIRVARFRSREELLRHMYYAHAREYLLSKTTTAGLNGQSWAISSPKSGDLNTENFHEGEQLESSEQFSRSRKSTTEFENNEQFSRNTSIKRGTLSKRKYTYDTKSFFFLAHSLQCGAEGHHSRFLLRDRGIKIAPNGALLVAGYSLNQALANQTSLLIASNPAIAPVLTSNQLTSAGFSETGFPEQPGKTVITPSAFNIDVNNNNNNIVSNSAEYLNASSLLLNLSEGNNPQSLATQSADGALSSADGGPQLYITETGELVNLGGDNTISAGGGESAVIYQLEDGTFITAAADQSAVEQQQFKIEHVDDNQLIASQSTAAVLDTFAPPYESRPFFPSVSSFRVRRRTRHDLGDSVGHRCRYCGKTLAYDRSLKQHIKAMHPSEWARIERERMRRFTSGLADRRTRFDLQSEPGYTCEYCGKTLAYDRSLKQHIKNVHRNLFTADDQQGGYGGGYDTAGVGGFRSAYTNSTFDDSILLGAAQQQLTSDSSAAGGVDIAALLSQAQSQNQTEGNQLIASSVDSNGTTTIFVGPDGTSYTLSTEQQQQLTESAVGEQGPLSITFTQTADGSIANEGVSADGMNVQLNNHNTSSYVLTAGGDPGISGGGSAGGALAIKRRTRFDLAGPGFLCDFCGKTLAYDRSLKQHIKTMHREEWERLKPTLMSRTGRDGRGLARRGPKPPPLLQSLIWNAGASAAGESADDVTADLSNAQQQQHMLYLDEASSYGNGNQLLQIQSADDYGAVFNNNGNSNLQQMSFY